MRQTPTTRNSTTAVAVKRRSLPVADFVILVLIVVALFASASGCKALYYDESAPNLQGQPAIENPMLVPMLDRWYVMDQVSNELDDYFKIYREERIRILDGIMSEGWIETHPEIGATLLEPWHEDSTAGFERIHATLQSVRRFAKVRVIPMENAFQIDVKVFKELEDLQQPIGSAIGGQPLRHDNALDVNYEDFPDVQPNDNWIPMGRDFSLEQLILRNIRQRLSQACADGQF